MSSDFTPGTGLLGGLLIGTSAALLLLGQGRIAGITGILGEALRGRRGDVGWRLLFLAGLIGGGSVLRLGWPGAFGGHLGLPPAALIAAGLLVGFGTRMGNGCTSGHGVCGVARLSRRSIVATCVFMATGALTVLLVRQAQGGAP